MARASHISGTVELANGATVITGTSSTWKSADIRAGDLFCADGLSIEIAANASSQTELTLVEPWPGTSLPAGSTYSIRYVDDGVRFGAYLNDVMTKINLVEGNVTDAQAAADAAAASAASIEEAATTAAAQSAAAVTARNEAEGFKTTASDKAAIATDKAAEANASATSSSTSSGQAVAAQTASEEARDESIAAKIASEGARDTAGTHKDDALAAKGAAEAARDTAQGHATVANTKAGEASDSAAAAATAKTGSEEARDESVLARNASQDAKTDSESARDTAQGHATTANTKAGEAAASATAADEARIAAEAARDEAQEALGLTNYYTKTETNGLLDAKANQATTYTKTETDAAISTGLANLVGAAPAALDTIYELAAEAQDQDSAIGALITTVASKADADDVYTKPEIDTMLAESGGSGSLEQSFVASGAIDGGLFVALRSDGKVEQITGTETRLSVGPENTEISVEGRFFLLEAVVHDATQKIVITYTSITAPIVSRIAVGTLSGDTIDFGAPYELSAGVAFGQIKPAWKSDGSVLWIAWNSGSSIQLTGFGVSGNSLTPGGSNATMIAATTTLQDVFADESLGRIIVLGIAHVGTASYSGITVTPVVTTTAFSTGATTNFRAYYDATNHRAILCGYSSNTTYIIAITVAAGSVTVGGLATQSTAVFQDADLDASGNLFFIAPISTGVTEYTGYVVTFSGATTTINSGVPLDLFHNSTGSVDVARVEINYNATLNKFFVALNVSYRSGSPTDATFCVLLATISGVSLIATDPVILHSGPIADNVPIRLYVKPDGTRGIILVNDEANGGRFVAKEFVQQGGDLFVSREYLLRNEIPFVNIASNRHKMVQSDWGLWSVNYFSDTIVAQTNILVSSIYHYTLPTESTNADAWVGIAKTDAINAASVDVTVSGIVAYEAGGLLPGLDYYLAADGTLTLYPDSGRFVGRALATNVIHIGGATSNKPTDVSRYVEAIQTLLDQTLVLKLAAEEAAADAETAKAYLETLTTGPVLGVNGQTGDVTGIATLKQVYAMSLVF